jgi:hypothetical protein
MNVAISPERLVAERVWFDATNGRLYVQAQDFTNSLDPRSVPDADFESAAPLVRFSIGQRGSVIVCHHRDGAETWLPVDMWLPD